MLSIEIKFIAKNIGYVTYTCELCEKYIAHTGLIVAPEIYARTKVRIMQCPNCGRRSNEETE